MRDTKLSEYQRGRNDGFSDGQSSRQYVIDLLDQEVKNLKKSLANNQILETLAKSMATTSDAIAHAITSLKR
jgi:hypothetical protein